MQILPRAWVGIFHETQAATGVAHKNINQTLPEPAGEHRQFHLVGNFVSPLPSRGNAKLMVVNHSK